MAKKRLKPKKRGSSCRKRRVWTPTEDAAIRSLVLKHGVKQWTLIANQLKKDFNINGRSGKQCRERWHNHLDQGIVKQAWTFEENFTLFTSHQEIGNKWAEISKCIPGRTDNSIKNHFYSTIRKVYRKTFGKEGSPLQIKQNIDVIVKKILKDLKKNQKFDESDNESYDESQSVDSDSSPEIVDMMKNSINNSEEMTFPQEWSQIQCNIPTDPNFLMLPFHQFEIFQNFYLSCFPQPSD